MALGRVDDLRLLKNRRRGLSILEIVVSMSLVMLFAAMSGMNPAPARERAGTDALAQVVAAELLRCRQIALARHIPVALGFPSQGATTPNTQQAYRLEGFEPLLTQVVDFAPETPTSYLTLGHYPLQGGFTWKPAGVSLGQSVAGFDLANWPDPYPDDPKLIFTPAGTVVSKLPKLQGNYQLQVAAGVSSAPSPLFGQPLHQLNQLQMPHTIKVSALGSVSVESGLPLAQAGVQVVQSIGINAAPASGPPAPAPGPPPGDLAPEVFDYRISPPPVAATLPPGIHATVAQGSSLGMTLIAREPNGEAITGKFWITRVPQNTGVFSQQKVMTFDPRLGGQVLHVEFVPPPEDAVGQVYDVQCKAFDPQGNFATFLIPSGGKVALTEPNRVIFDSDRTGNHELYSCKPDGTDIVQLTSHPAMDRSPRWSPDGRKFLFHSDRNFGIFGLFSANADGSNVRPLVTAGVLGGNKPAEHGACWSPDGTQIAVVNTVGEWWKVKADGSNPVQLFAGTSPSRLAWHPGGRWVAGIDANSIWLVDSTLVDPPKILLTDVALYADSQVAFSPDGGKLLFNRNRDLEVADFAPIAGGLTNFVNLTNSADKEAQACWSPDGLSVLVDAYSPDCTVYQYFLNAPGVRKDFLVRPLCDNDPHWGRAF